MRVDRFQAPDYFQIDDLLSDEQKLIRNTVREWVRYEFLQIRG